MHPLRMTCNRPAVISLHVRPASLFVCLFVLCCLVTPGLSKDILCHVGPYFFYKQVQISRSDIRPHIKWAVSLVILHMVTSMSLQGCVGIYGLTYSLYHPRGYLTHYFVPGRMILGNVRPYGRMVLRGDACFLLMCVPCQGSLDSYCSLVSAQQSASKRCSVCENRVSLVLHISGAHL